MPERMSEYMPESMSEYMPESMSEQMPDRMSDRVSYIVRINMPYIPDGMLEAMLEQLVQGGDHWKTINNKSSS